MIDVEIVKFARRAVAPESRRIGIDAGAAQELRDDGPVLLAHLLLDTIGAQALHLAAHKDPRLINGIAEVGPRIAADDHIAGLGTSLGRSIDAYNRAVGSLERQVLPSARRFTELGITERKNLATVEPIDKTARTPAGKDEPVARPVPKDAG